MTPRIRSALRLARAGLILLAAAPLAAQEESAARMLERGTVLAAEGDTATALALLERAAAQDPGLAEAHFRLGRIYAQRATGDAYDFEDRLRAQQAFEAALAQDPDNPMYILELGKLLLMQGRRLDGRRLFRRAEELAARADPATEAEVHFQLGVFSENQWRRFRDRHLLPRGMRVNVSFAFHDPGSAWALLERASYPGPGQGAEDREEMEARYRAALAALPGHVPAASHLMAALYDEGRIEELMEVATPLAAAAPDHPAAYLGLGLAHTAQGGIDEAAGAFQYALSLMHPAERVAVETLARLLSKESAREYETLAEEQRREYDRRYWTSSDPVFLSDANEFWVEYMARAAYADFRFGVEEYRLRGWQTDRGAIWLRYGRPAKLATFPASTTTTGDDFSAGKIYTVWAYGPRGPVFVFDQNPGYRNAGFAGDFEWYAENLRSVQAAAFEPDFLPERLDLPVQIARFRGPFPGQMDVEVHGQLPLPELSAGESRVEVESGLFVQDSRSREVRRVVRTDTVSAHEPRLRSWRLTLADAGEHLFGIEARAADGHVVAVARERVGTRSFEPGALALSDLLLAARVEPSREQPEVRGDFEIEPSPTRVFAPGNPVHAYAELYNLLPDEEGYASYELRLTVRIEEIDRGDAPAGVRLFAGIADRLGLTREGEDAAELSFERQTRVVARDLIPEYFSIQLPDAPPGRYSMTLRVIDRNAGREVSAGREFVIGNP